MPNTVKTPQTFLTENNFFATVDITGVSVNQKLEHTEVIPNYNLKETRTAMPLPKQNDSSSVDHKENKLELPLCFVVYFLATFKVQFADKTM